MLRLYTGFRSLRSLSTIPQYDVMVIGGGPGGYVAAIRSAQLGLKTICVDKNDILGGTCLNVGCIPSKTLLHASHLYDSAKKSLSHHGIQVDNLRMDLNKMMERKKKVVNGLGKGIDQLFKKNGVDRIQGIAKIIDQNHVQVSDTKYYAKNIVIATGSESIAIPGIEIDESVIVSSTGALSLPEIPKHLVVVGGGVIGLELGSVWNRLGSKVTVVESLGSIGAGMDGKTSKHLQTILSKQGIQFKLDTKVIHASKTGNQECKLDLESRDGRETIQTNVVLIAVGRRPNTSGLELEKLGIKTDRGRIVVDDQFRTSVPTIRAIGDVVPGPMLAHRAEEEGIAVAELLASKHPHSIRYDSIPSVIYTHPEVAWVGKTEEQLQKEGREYLVGEFPFVANSRAQTSGDPEGMVRILGCPKTGLCLGAHIIGPNAGEMISEAVFAIRFGLKVSEIGSTCHPHPSFSEAFKEACVLASGSKTIHF